MVLAAPTSAWRMGTGRPEIDDDAELHTDEIVVEPNRYCGSDTRNLGLPTVQLYWFFHKFRRWRWAG